MSKKDEAQADPMAEGSSYDHKTGTLSEPAKADEPQVRRHQVDPVSDPALFEEANENPPIPRRGDPYAHQRDEKAAKAGYEKEAKADERSKEEREAAEQNNLSAAERAKK
jgi:hypothetical protein